MYLTDEELIIARARRVTALLRSDDVREAFAEIEREFFAEFGSCQPEQVVSLRHSWDGYQRLRNKLQAWADELTLREKQG